AQIVRIEFLAADAAAERRDQRADLRRLQQLVESSFFDVQDLALERQHGLRTAIVALLRGAAGRVTLDEEQLRQRRILLLAVRELAGQPGDVERALPARHLASLAGRLPRAGRLDDLADDDLGLGRMLEQERVKLVRDDRLGNRLDLGRHELVLGLRRELRIRQLDGQHGRQALTGVVAGGADLLALAAALALDA